MSELEQFAIFLRDYGAYAMASVFAGLYALERRERRATQTRYERHLVDAPDAMREFADAQANALENLERAFIKVGIDIEPPADEDGN